MEQAVAGGSIEHIGEMDGSGRSPGQRGRDRVRVGDGRVNGLDLPVGTTPGSHDAEQGRQVQDQELLSNPRGGRFHGSDLSQLVTPVESVHNNSLRRIF